MGKPQTPPEVDADFAEVADQRRADRRHSDRRAPRQRLDTLFAALLINQVEMIPAFAPARAYAPSPTMPRGRRVNVRT